MAGDELAVPLDWWTSLIASVWAIEKTCFGATSPGHQNALIPMFVAHTPNVKTGATVHVLCFVQSYNRHQVAFLCFKYLGYVRNNCILARWASHGGVSLLAILTNITSSTSSTTCNTRSITEFASYSEASLGSRKVSNLEMISWFIQGKKLCRVRDSLGPWSQSMILHIKTSITKDGPTPQMLISTCRSPALVYRSITLSQTKAKKKKSRTRWLPSCQGKNETKRRRRSC